MKQCSQCGSFQDDNASFCANCGSSSFVISQKQNHGQAGNKPKKNKKKIGLGMTSGFICLILTFAIPHAIRQGLRDYREKQEKEEQRSALLDIVDNPVVKDIISDVDDEIPYTKGTIVNKKYQNEWAGIQFELPENFSLDEDYAKYDNDTLDTGCACVDYENGKALILTFSDFTDVMESFDENRVLENNIEDFKNDVAADADADINYVISDMYDYTIADKQYRAVDIFVQENSYNIRYCVLVKDKRIIEFYVGSHDKDEIDEILNSIEVL